MAKNWYPKIDKEKCIECLTCYNFCKNNVYKLEQEKVVVANPDNCVLNCHGCEKQCPTGAISYVDLTNESVDYTGTYCSIKSDNHR